MKTSRLSLRNLPVEAALLCEKAGASSIVAHLREDRRHINDKDVKKLKASCQTKFNLEMSIAKEIVDIACLIHPHQVTLVPEKSQELTTEGGLDIISKHDEVHRAIDRLKKEKIEISIFLEPDERQIEKATMLNAEFIELHTGAYAEAKTEATISKELNRLRQAAKFSASKGLGVNAGHGLNYENVQSICRIPEIRELNIGHSSVSRAVFVGMDTAVRQMLELLGNK